MERIKGFLGNVRRRRLALFLVFALILGIAPKVQIFAAKSDPNNTAVAVRRVNDASASPSASAAASPDTSTTPSSTSPSTSPQPTVDPAYVEKAETFLGYVTNLLNTSFSEIDTFGKGIYTVGADGKLNYTAYTGMLGTIIRHLAQDGGNTDTRLNENPIVRNARALREPLANEKVTAYLNILELIRYADTANEAIKNGIEGTSISDANYLDFKERYNRAKTLLEDYYYPEFETQQNLDVLGNCLGSKTDVTVRKTIKNARITYLSKYEDMTKEYNILEKFADVVSKVDMSQGTGSFSYEFNDSTLEQARQLREVVDANGGDAYLRLLYKEDQIRPFLENYRIISNILIPLSAINDVPSTTEEIQEMARIQRLYDALSSELKAMIPQDKLIKMKTYGSGNIEVSDVSTLIGLITYPKNDTEYATFKDVYNTAYSAYLGLLKKYGTNSGIGKLVNGIDDLLGDMTKVYNFLERVHAILNLEDNQVCNDYNEMKKIVEDYNNQSVLSTVNQSRIYNYVSFYTMYQNATAAYNLRTRVDKLLLTLTADEKDKQEVTAIRKDYSALNAKAKAYFGTLYAGYIEELEYGNYAKSLELAARVDELIGRIGTVNTNSGQKIADAEAAYNALTEMQKALVKTYATLVAARKAYDQIKNDISKAKVVGVKTGYVYTRSNICPSPRVIIDNQQLVAGTDYTLSYSSNKKVGTGKITISAVSGSGYYGTYVKSFKIVKDSISDGGVSGIAKSYKYTGKTIKPRPTLKVNGYILTKGKDYTVSYKNNKKKGTATIIMKGKGNYKGTKKKKFKIK